MGCFFQGLWHNECMPSNLRRAWELYFAFAIVLTAGRAYSFFTPDMPEHLYLHVLYAFNPEFPAAYVLTILQISLSVFHWLPLALYILGRPLGPRLLWQIMFVLRIIFDVIGNSYARNILVSLYRNDSLLCLLTLLFLTLPYVLWYWACFRYAFVNSRK